MADEIRQTTLRLPDDLYRWLRRYAFDIERTQNEIVVKAITEHRERIEREGEGR